MIVLFKSVDPSRTQPVVIVDYTRSDEQYSITEILKWVNQFAPLDAGVVLDPVIYSLDYSATFTHSGINYGKSLKQSFEASITNSPIELVRLLNIEQYASTQNISSLSSSLGSIIDPQVIYPSGGIVFKDLTGKSIFRKFIVYSTPFNFDDRRINSTLVIKGAQFDSMVIKLNFSANIKKSEPLMPQIASILSGKDLSVDAKSLSDLGSMNPVLDKYYAPAPANVVLGEICRDNNLAFNNNNGIISFISLAPNTPPLQDIKNRFSFSNSVPNSKVISSFSLSDYVRCEFESDIYDPELFTSVSVFDDSKTTGLFANLSKSPDLLSGYQGYRFYIQEYSLHDSRDKTSATTRGTNNWLMSNFKIDHLLENKIYQGAV